MLSSKRTKCLDFLPALCLHFLPELNACTVVLVVALWPVEHASHARDLGSNPV